jgi:hypothetical protein
MIIHRGEQYDGSITPYTLRFRIGINGSTYKTKKMANLVRFINTLEEEPPPSPGISEMDIKIGRDRQMLERF